MEVTPLALEPPITLRDLVTLPTAQRLFMEARDWTSGRQLYMSIDSEIRAIATKAFPQVLVMHLMEVCHEIFYVLACEFQDVPR